MDNNDISLAIAMTSTWFNMLPEPLKGEYLKDFDSYSNEFINVYNKSIDSMRKKEEESLPYFTRGGSLEGRIK